MEKYTIRDAQEGEEELMKKMNHMAACLQRVHGEMAFDQSGMTRLVFKNGVIFEPTFRQQRVSLDIVWLRKYPLHLN
jgi:hypothetical protein